MADVKISQLPASTTPLDGTEVLPIVQSATTKQVSVANLTAGRAVSALSLSLTNALPVSSGGTGLQTTGAGTFLVSATANSVSATATPSLGVASTTSGTLSLYNSSSANAVTIASGNNSGAWTFTLPTSGGTNNYILTTNGSGATQWTNPTALGIDLNVGATVVSDGTSGRILYNNAGVLGEYAVTGTGTTAVLSTSPTFTTGLTTPLAIGGTAASSSLTLQSTSGVGTSDSISFKVGNNGATTAATIDTAGNVGIGTTSPNFKLQVIGAANIQGGTFQVGTAGGNRYVTIGSTGLTTLRYDDNSAASNLSLQNLGITGVDQGTQIVAKFSADASSTYNGGAIRFGNSGTYTSTASTQNSYLSFYTASSGTDGERVRITSDGKVGINKTNPSADLDVTGTIIASSYIQSLGAIYTSGTIISSNSPSNPLTFGINDAEKMRISTSGNVGIGTTNPALKFVVSNGGAEGLEIDPTAVGTAPVIATYNRSSGAYLQCSFRGNNFAWLNGSATQVMSLDTSNNLLVGTTSSDARFVAYTTGDVWTGRFLNGSGGGTPNGVQVIVGQNSTNLVFQVGQGTSFSTFTNLFKIQGNGLINTGAASVSPYNNTTATAANMVVTSAGDLQRSTSSLRYKTDIQNAIHGLKDVMKLRSVTYKGKNDGDVILGGLIAEEVDVAGLTEFVVYDTEGRPDALHYGNMVSLAFKAIQELAAKVSALEAKQ